MVHQVPGVVTRGRLRNSSGPSSLAMATGSYRARLDPQHNGRANLVHRAVLLGSWRTPPGPWTRRPPRGAGEFASGCQASPGSSPAKETSRTSRLRPPARRYTGPAACFVRHPHPRESLMGAGRRKPFKREGLGDDCPGDRLISIMGFRTGSAAEGWLPQVPTGKADRAGSRATNVRVSLPISIMGFRTGLSRCPRPDRPGPEAGDGLLDVGGDRRRLGLSYTHAPMG